MTAPGSTSVAELSRRHRARAAVRSRLRESASRTRSGVFTTLRGAAAAALAYLLSTVLWGHTHPVFAAIAAFVIIGVSSTEKKIRKVGEMSSGVMLGVLLGELARSTIGSGSWQILVVITVAGLLARFIDSGVMFAMQCSIQSLLVMLMPVTPGLAPGARVLDALTGVSAAILIHLLLTGDPRRAQRDAADALFRALEDALTQLSLAARTGDAAVARATLAEVRRTSQGLVDEWRIANSAADEVTAYSPTNLRHAADVERLRQLLVGSDRAMRNVRVIARREVQFLSVVDGDPHSTLADALLEAKDAATALREAVDTDVDFTEARRELRLFCSYLTPEMLLKNDAGQHPGRVGHFEGVTLAIQLRSLASDLLEATGLSPAEAQRFLPSLLVAGDGDTIGPRPLTQEIRAIEPPPTTAALELLITDRSDPDRRRPSPPPEAGVAAAGETAGGTAGAEGAAATAATGPAAAGPGALDSPDPAPEGPRAGAPGSGR